MSIRASTAALVACLVAMPAGADETAPFNGWRPSNFGPQEAAGSTAFGDSQLGAGGEMLLYEFFPDGLTPRHQGRTPSCVGYATAGAIDVLQAQQIYGLGSKPAPVYPSSAAAIYALSRIEVAQNDLGINLTSRWPWPYRVDGSCVAWAMVAVAEYGTLPIRDLPGPDRTLCENWKNSGLPDDLEPVAAKYRVLRYGRCFSYADVRGALSKGWPVVVGTHVGFAKTRDDEGFLAASEDWGHAWYMCGYTERANRHGVCGMNSWGDKWASGPNRLGAPPGSWWMTPADVERVLENGEAWYIGDFQGYSPWARSSEHWRQCEFGGRYDPYCVPGSLSPSRRCVEFCY